MLSEIIVKGQMPKTKLTGNSMVTTIQGTVLGQSGTAKEMLAKVPGMTLKGEDLEVLGKGTPIFSSVVRIKTIRREGDGFGMVNYWKWD